MKEKNQPQKIKITTSKSRLADEPKTSSEPETPRVSKGVTVNPIKVEPEARPKAETKPKAETAASDTQKPEDTAPAPKELADTKDPLADTIWHQDSSSLDGGFTEDIQESEAYQLAHNKAHKDNVYTHEEFYSSKLQIKDDNKAEDTPKPQPKAKKQSISIKRIMILFLFFMVSLGIAFGAFYYLEIPFPTLPFELPYSF